jgi:hypothetical protein
MPYDYSVIAGFLQSLDSYESLHKIELIQSESNGVYKTYKVVYSTDKEKKVKLRIELDFQHKKLSSAKWKDRSFTTKKFKYYLK